MVRTADLGTISCSVMFLSVLYFTPSMGDSICKKIGSYNVFYPGDCGKYYECHNGAATVKSCTWFHSFDENTGRCRPHMWLYTEVNCTSAVQAVTHPVTDTTSSSTSTTTTPTTEAATTTTTASSTTAKTPTSATKGSTTKKGSASSVEISAVLIMTLAVLTLKYHQ